MKPGRSETALTHAYQHAEYLKSVHALSELPPDQGLEVAFAGRSNAGKSSALNAISGRKGLARISKTPGRTQLINLFGCAPGVTLVDLPGYGYAKVPERIRDHWKEVLPAYLASRRALRGVVLIMDCRHPLQAFDRQMLLWTTHRCLPVHVLLSKADKLSRGQAATTLQEVRKAVATAHPNVGVQLFSARTGIGVDAARAKLDVWFAQPTDMAETLDDGGT
jgi:GTP-binding protein